MIEGLRVAPAYLDAQGQSPPQGRPAPFATCQECRQNVPAETRQQYGCGYEPPIPRPSGVWMPAACREGKRPALTTCAAYTTGLPLVREAMAAYPHWKERTLAEYLDGEAPSPAFLDLLATFEAGIRERDADAMKAAQRKGA